MVKIHVEFAQGYGIRQTLIRPLRVSWENPVLPKLSEGQKNVLRDVGNYNLFIGVQTNSRTAYDERLSKAFLDTKTAMLGFTSHSVDWHNGGFILHVARRYCPEDPARFALAICNELPNMSSDVIDKLTIAAYLHGIRTTILGKTFSFVAGFHLGMDELAIGVRVEKKSMGIPEPLFTLPDSFEEDDAMLVGAHFFYTDPANYSQNCFFTSDDFGVGYILLRLTSSNRSMKMGAIQDSIYLVDLCRKAQKSGGELRKESHTLRSWKHLAVGIIESLGKELGYTDIKGLNHSRFSHLYAGLFSKRLDFEGNPAYKLQPPRFDCKEVRSWVLQQRDIVP